MLPEDNSLFCRKAVMLHEASKCLRISRIRDWELVSNSSTREASLRRSVSNLGLEISDGSPPDGLI